MPQQKNDEKKPGFFARIKQLFTSEKQQSISEPVVVKGALRPENARPSTNEYGSATPENKRPQGAEYGTAGQGVQKNYVNVDLNTELKKRLQSKKPNAYSEIPVRSNDEPATKYTGMPIADNASKENIKPAAPPNNYGAAAKEADPKKAIPPSNYKDMAAKAELPNNDRAPVTEPAPKGNYVDVAAKSNPKASSASPTPAAATNYKAMKAPPEEMNAPPKEMHKPVDINRISEAEVDKAFAANTGFPFAFKNFETALKNQDPNKLAEQLGVQLDPDKQYTLHTADIAIDKKDNLHVNVVLKDQDGKRVNVEQDYNLQDKKELKSLVDFVNKNAENATPTTSPAKAAENVAALNNAGSNYGSTEPAPKQTAQEMRAQKSAATEYSGMPPTPQNPEYGSVPGASPKSDYGSVPNASQSQVSRLAALFEANIQEQKPAPKAPNSPSMPSTRFDAGTTATASNNNNSPPAKPSQLPPTLFAKYQTKPTTGKEVSAASSKGATVPAATEAVTERSTKLRS